MTNHAHLSIVPPETGVLLDLGRPQLVRPFVAPADAGAVRLDPIGGPSISPGRDRSPRPDGEHDAASARSAAPVRSARPATATGPDLSAASVRSAGPALPTGRSAPVRVVGDARRTRSGDTEPSPVPDPPARPHDTPGAGVLSPLLADPTVTDVLVNRGDVWVDRGAGLTRAAVAIGSAADVRRLAQRLATACGRRLDEASPYVDGRLPDGTRLHAVLPPVATGGPYLSLRTFRHRAFSLDELIDCGTVGRTGADLLAAIVAARLSFLVTGGTGTGKTTILGTMLGLVPDDQRIVLVEDSPELRPDHPHVVGLSARTANVEGAGTVTLRDLLRQALRMRPDRLIVGECRGVEVVDLLAALNTGHEGGAGTLHANTAADVPARLEALGLVSGVPRVAVHAQMAAAIQVVVHMRRLATGRVVDEIVVMRSTGPDRTVSVLSAWHRLGGVRPGAHALATLLARRGAQPPAGLLADGPRMTGPAIRSGSAVPPAGPRHTRPEPRPGDRG